MSELALGTLCSLSVVSEVVVVLSCLVSVYPRFSRETPQICHSCQAQMPFSAGMDPKPSKAPHMGGLPDENGQIQRYDANDTASMNLCICSLIVNLIE